MNCPEELVELGTADDFVDARLGTGVTGTGSAGISSAGDGVNDGGTEGAPDSLS